MKKILLIIALTIPALYLTYEIVFIQNVNDPIKHIYTFTGVSTIVLILSSILISPLKKFINFMKYRKIIGLFGFFYAFLHFLNFIVLDAELSLAFIISETIKKPFIYLGFFSFLILLYMAVTSTKKLYKEYMKFHKLVYVSVIAFFIHTIMAQKSIVLIDAIFIIIIVIVGIIKLFQYKNIFIKN